MDSSLIAGRAVSITCTGKLLCGVASVGCDDSIEDNETSVGGDSCSTAVPSRLKVGFGSFGTERRGAEHFESSESRTNPERAVACCAAGKDRHSRTKWFPMHSRHSSEGLLNSFDYLDGSVEGTRT